MSNKPSTDPEALNENRTLAYYNISTNPADTIYFTQAVFEDNEILDENTGKIYGFNLTFNSDQSCNLEPTLGE